MTDYLDYVRKAIEHFGRFPTVEEYGEFAKERQYPSYVTLLKHTKKRWAEIQVELGAFRFNRDPDTIAHHLREAAKIYGNALTKREYIAYYKQTAGAPSLNDITLTFSTFNKAKEYCGLFANRGFGTKEVSQDECIQALKAFVRDTGKERFGETDYDLWAKGTQYPSSVTIRKRFGLFGTAILDAGFKPSVAITEEDMMRDMLDYFRECIRLKEYNAWAVSNGRPKFDARRHNFREFAKNAADIYFSRRQ